MKRSEKTPLTASESAEKFHKEKWRRFYQIAVVFVMLGIVAGLNLWYTNYVDHKNRQGWCDLIVTLDKGYAVQPPTTETGRQLAELTHRRRQSLGCD